MRTLEDMKVFGEHAASVLVPMPTTITYYPSNSAWLTIKDSALLPIVDKMLVRNYWGVDASEARKTFTITLESCSRSPGIRVHDAL